MEPEYKPVSAYVMENGQLVQRTLYQKMRGDGKPHFPKSQTFHLCARLEDCAADILERCIAANDCYFETEYEERLAGLFFHIDNMHLLVHSMPINQRRR